jgi:hypothetical protein
MRSFKQLQKLTCQTDKEQSQYNEPPLNTITFYQEFMTSTSNEITKWVYYLINYSLISDEYMSGTLSDINKWVHVHNLINKSLIKRSVHVMKSTNKIPNENIER